MTTEYQFREFDEKQREKSAEKGHAMPDGSFPIENEKDLANARQAVGRAKDPEAAKAHIRKRAKELGVALPESFFAEGGEKFYSDSQARDEHGRWTAGGTQEGAHAEKTNSPSGHSKAAKYHQAAADWHKAEAASPGNSPEKTIEHTEAAKAHAHASAQHEKAAKSPGFFAHKIAQGASKVAHSASSEAHTGNTAWARHRAGSPLSSKEIDALRLVAGAQSAMRVSFSAEALELADEPETRLVNGVEYVVGKPIHIFPNGRWTAVDGREVEFNAQDARAMISDLESRDSDVALTFDHETDKARGSASAGWMPRNKFVFKEDGLWNMEPLWVKDDYEQLLKTGRFRYLSGDALGVGTAHPGDAFHPRRLLAASLVPKPGFVRGLKGIQMAADVSAQVNAWVGKEETFMSKMTRAQLCERMGLKASATTDELKDAFSKFMDEEGAEPEHAQMGANDDDGDEGAGDDDAACTDENCKDPECKTHGDQNKEEKMGANNEAAPATGADEKLVAEKFAALGAEIADKTMTAAKTAAEEAAEKRLNERFSAMKRAEETEALLTQAETDGVITAANREVFRETFAANFEHGKKLLAALPKPAVAPGERLSARNAFITGNGNGVANVEEMAAIFKNPEKDPRKYAEQSRVLTEVARFSANEHLTLEEAFAGVLRGENEKLEKELFAAGDNTAEKFVGSRVGQFRASQRQIPIDPDMVEFIRKRAREGKIPTALVSEEIQRFASVSDFQPSAKTTLPMALGFFNADSIGDEVLPVFIGGADEKAAWPEFGFEKFAAVAAAAGYLGAPTRTSLNVTWHTVTLEKYPIQIDIDRRARAASVTLPRGIDTIALENIKSQVATTKELAQATFMKTTGNYFDNTYYPSLAQPWSNAGTPAAYVGLPMDDITKGMAHIRSGIRTWPDLLVLSPNAALSLRKNQQIIDTVRYTGTKSDPGTMVPNQTLAALFAGLMNLTIVVGEAGYSSLPSGTGVADTWGNDAWLVATGKGKIEAPRFGVTVGSAGSPRVRAFPQEGLGADGADSLVYTDAWSLVSVNKKSAYWMQGASAAL